MSKETKLETLQASVQAEELAYLQVLSRLLGESSAIDLKDEMKQANDALNRAAALCAYALKVHPKNSGLHYKLGLFIEEKGLLQDLFNANESKASKDTSAQIGGDGITLEGYEDGDDIGDLPDGTFDQGSSINKEDDIRAICELHNVSRNAPMGAVLKALDTEYQHLREVSNFSKADYVQGLYSWKSRQAKSIGRSILSPAVADAQSPLARANTKNHDAYSLDQASKE